MGLGNSIDNIGFIIILNCKIQFINDSIRFGKIRENIVFLDIKLL